MISTVQCNINSKDGIQNNGSMKSDVFFNLKNIVEDSKTTAYVDFSVESVQIPISFYNITNLNNKLDWNGTLLTIPHGNYNTTSLRTALLYQLIANGISTVTIVFSTVTGKYSFSDSLANFTLYYATSTIFNILGFIVNQNHTSNTLTLTSTYPVNLLGTLKLKLSSKEINITNIDSASGGHVNTLVEIPISASNFGLILYTNVSNIHSVLHQKSLNGFSIRITDDSGDLVDFNNIDWAASLLFKIHHIQIKNKIPPIKENVEPILEQIPPIKENPEPIKELTDDEILLANE